MAKRSSPAKRRRRPVDLVSLALWLLMAVVTTLMAWVVVRPIWDVTAWF